MQLHDRLVLVEEQILDLAHLCPVRATVHAGNRDMLPAEIGSRDNAECAAVDLRRDDEGTACLVSGESFMVRRERSSGQAVLIQKMKVSHNPTPSGSPRHFFTVHPSPSNTLASTTFGLA